MLSHFKKEEWGVQLSEVNEDDCWEPTTRTPFCYVQNAKTKPQRNLLVYNKK